MGLETGTYVDDLIVTNPDGANDPKSQGDDHLRLIKAVLKATLPNATRALDIRGALGGQVSTELTISTGSVTPVANRHTVDTQSDDPTDDLANVITTNIPDGGLLLLRAENDARTIVVKHAATGAGQIFLADNADFSLDQADKLLLLERSGADWLEVLRDFGSDIAARRAYSGTQEDVITTEGDLVVGNATPEASRLAVGAAGTELTSDGTNPAWTAIPEISLPRSYLAGLALSNNAGDATNDIDIAVGVARSTANLEVDSAIGKQINASWASGGTPGTTTGGMSSSLHPVQDDTTYAVILGLVSGVEEVGFDTSPTGANLVTDHSFTAPRRIGWVNRLTAANQLFLQHGDTFQLQTPVKDVDITNPGNSAVNRTLASLPNGGEVDAILGVSLHNANSSTTGHIFVSDPATTSISPDSQTADTGLAQASSSNAAVMNAPKIVRTNASAQVQTQFAGTSNSNVRVALHTRGWIDRRGRDD